MKFCVSLTTIPSRLKTIHKTINSINAQILKPNKIYLSIPNNYKRFKEQIDENYLKNLNFDNVKIIRCEDFGPSTSFLGPLNEIINKYEFMIIINDDHIYDKNITDIMIRNYKKEQINYSFYLQKVFDIQMAQTADAFLIKTNLILNAYRFYKIYVENNKNLRMDDDLWISIYLQKIMQSKIKNLINEFKTLTNKEMIYSVHTTLDSLIHTTHKRKVFWNRRKIAKYELIKFKIKNYFNKFKIN